MSKTSSKSKDYHQLNQELAEIIAWFESGSTEVDKSIDKYEQALKIIAEIEKYLKTAENRLRKINANLK